MTAKMAEKHLQCFFPYLLAAIFFSDYCLVFNKPIEIRELTTSIHSLSFQSGVAGKEKARENRYIK